MTTPIIRPASETDLASFFPYLADQLSDNGQHGNPLFQPMPRGQRGVPPGRVDAFTRGMATPLTEPKLSAGFPNGDGRFMVTLYRLVVEVVGPDGDVLDSFEVERMGWTLGGLT